MNSCTKFLTLNNTPLIIFREEKPENWDKIKQRYRGSIDNKNKEQLEYLK